MREKNANQFYFYQLLFLKIEQKNKINAFVFPVTPSPALTKPEMEFAVDKQQQQQRIPVIVFVGPANHGKTTASEMALQYMTSACGLNMSAPSHRLSFASPLKEALMHLFDIERDVLFCDRRKAEKETLDPRWGRSPRQLLQSLGDWARKEGGEDFFVNRVAIKLSFLLKTGAIVAVDDCRYLEEARMLKRMGAYIVRLNRSSDENGVQMQEEAAAHSSEKGIPMALVDDYIYNNGTIESLQKEVKGAVRRMFSFAQTKKYAEDQAFYENLHLDKLYHRENWFQGM
jgi:hypothetical protein